MTEKYHTWKRYFLFSILFFFYFLDLKKEKIDISSKFYPSSCYWTDLTALPIIFSFFWSKCHKLKTWLKEIKFQLKLFFFLFLSKIELLHPFYLAYPCLWGWSKVLHPEKPPSACRCTSCPWRSWTVWKCQWLSIWKNLLSDNMILSN